MEAIIITKDQFNELLAKVEHIIKTIDGIIADPKESFVDNAEFLRIMGVSKRTAQTWRDEQRIAFSQIGSKIYYSISDVNQLLAKNHRPAYQPRNRRLSSRT